jgi:Flp pilus assembly protein TadG
MGVALLEAGGRTMKRGFSRGVRALLDGLGRRKGRTTQVSRPEAGPSRGRIPGFCFGREDGNSLIEFTMTLPVLMAVLTAIFEFGIAFNNQLQLTQAVGAGAQYLQQIRQTTTDPCKDTFTAIENSAPTLQPGNITLTLTMNGNSPVTASTCSGDQSELAQGEPVTVYASYPCSIAIYGFKFSSSCKLTAQVTEYEY